MMFNPGRHILLCIVAVLQLLATTAVQGDDTITWVDGYDQGLSDSRQSNRPALIYFQAPWCSWCHVYERDTLGNPQVISTISQHYTPVLVNYDARPDLLARYKGFGLPFTVILSAQGELLARLPGILTPEDMQHTLQRFIGTQKPDQAQTGEILARVTKLDVQAYQDFVSRWLDHLDDLYDPETGTFSGVLDSGAGLKRSAPLAWEFMLEHDLWPERSRRAARSIYNNLYDNRYGGLFYFRDPHRQDEHIETAKLLDANAWLVHWFLLAGTLYKDQVLLDAARNSYDYLQRVLWDQEEGGFFQAQVSDADYYRPNGKPVNPPALDRIKRADSNAQAIVALMAAGKLNNDQTMIERALETTQYLLANHVQDNRLYHSRDVDGFGPAFNLPQDIFWLLAAIQSAQDANASVAASKQTDIIYLLAGRWLNKAMQNKPDENVSNKLLGIIAWVAINTDNPVIPRQTTAWALSRIRIESTTRPDDLVYALKAWHRYVNSLN